ncbi:MAG: hypothetical protein KJ732_04005 [Candidatus Margulisbacteria bacterium]|nr:hypothetical protein [Candidatus Margulisiibacteriota bacterium]
MEDEINLREYIEVITKRWKTIAFIALGIAMIVFVYNLMQPPVYDAKTTIMIRSGGGSSFSQLAGLTALAGINLPSGKGSLSDLTEILQSKAVAEKVLEDLKLKERIEDLADPRLNHQIIVSKVKNMLSKPKINGNLIELNVENSDPELAAEIANGFVNALSYSWNRLNYTEARKKREYIESQLPRVEKDLKKAEQRLKKFTLLSPKGGNSNSELMGLVSGSRSDGVEISRLSRELAVQNSVYTMLRNEYESVKLEESKEISLFSVVDPAVPPDSKSKPKIKVNTIIGLVLGLYCGTIVIFFQEYLEKHKQNHKI